MYKILSGCIASRIKNVLSDLIHENQTGFMAGRYIGENTRILYDTMAFTEENNIPGLALFVDFEKAFDSISWKFMWKVLRFFNFGPVLLDWIYLLNKDIKLCVIQNGFFS